MQITFLPLPSTLRVWEAPQIERTREALRTGSYWNDGVLYWASNDRPVPASVFREAYVEMPAAQAATADASTQAFLAEYRRTNANRQLSGEERAEMRASFGPGATVVDVVTGQKWRV